MIGWRIVNILGSTDRSAFRHQFRLRSEHEGCLGLLLSCSHVWSIGKAKETGQRSAYCLRCLGPDCGPGPLYYVIMSGSAPGCLAFLKAVCCTIYTPFKSPFQTIGITRPLLNILLSTFSYFICNPPKKMAYSIWPVVIHYLHKFYGYAGHW